jgi:hypothetical protein
LVAGYASGLVEGRVLRREPSIPLEGARMAATRMIFSDARARRELGYSSRPAVEAIVRSARWYADNGRVSAKRLARIRWNDVAGNGETAEFAQAAGMGSRSDPKGTD